MKIQIPAALVTFLICFNRTFCAAHADLVERLYALPEKEKHSLMRGWTLEEYKKADATLQQMKNPIDTSAFKHLSGGITSYMSPHEIETALHERFCAYYKSGKIITPEAFELIKEQYFIPKDKTPPKDLTRLWGNEYLKFSFERDGKRARYDVPDFIIVSPTPEKISVKVIIPPPQFPPFQPRAETIEDESAIYYKNIEGIPDNQGSLLAYEEDEYLNSLGFADFKAGNVRLNQEEEKFYVIDTEIKSFELYNNPHAKDPLAQLFTPDERRALLFAHAALKLLLKDSYNLLNNQSFILHLDVTNCSK